MAANAQQLVRLAQRILRQTGGKLSATAVVGLCLTAVLYAAVIQPAVEKRFGVSLPSILADGGPGPQANQRTTTQRPSLPDDSPAEAEAPPVDPRELSGVLTSEGRGVYRSPAGLRYTRGSRHGHRLAHVMAHTRDDPDRPGQHGVFDETDPAAVVLLLDDAYEQALTGNDVRTRQEEERTVYTVDLGRRVGYIGGQSGARRGRPAARSVQLVVQGDRLITAYPIREGR